MILKFKKKSTGLNSLIGLFLIGLIFIVMFFVGGNPSLLKQNINNWPKVKAEVTSVEQNIVCETPERSGACYPIFTIKYLYFINGERYSSQMEQMYTTNYSPGNTFDVYYKKDNPQFVFTEGKNPTKTELSLPLISGLLIIITVIVLWIRRKQPKTND